jgi:hypothetical protein
MDANPNLFSIQISALPLPNGIGDRLKERGIAVVGDLFSLSRKAKAALTSIDDDQKREEFLRVLEGVGLSVALTEGSERAVLNFNHVGPEQQCQLVLDLKVLRVSARARSLFRKLRIRFVGDLIQYSADDLLSEKNVGRRTLNEIQSELKRLGVDLGTTVIGWDRRVAGRIAAAQDGPVTEYLREHEGLPATRIHLEEQIANLLSRFASEKWVRIAMKFYGFDGSGQKTLEAVGHEFGLTRERIRQIISKMRDRFPQRLKLAMLPAAIEVMDVVEQKVPCSVDDIEQALLDMELTATKFDATGIGSLFVFDNESPPFEIVELEGGAKLLTPVGTGELIGIINSKAGKLVSRWGVTTVSEVCSQIDTSLSRDLVRKILGGLPDIAWLDEKQNWFTLVAAKRNRLLNLVAKVLAVAPGINLAELRRAISRSHRMKGFAPPQTVLARFCNVQDGLSLDEDRVTSKGSLGSTDKLANIEQDFVDVLTRIGPVARREEIEQECTKIGMNRHSFYVYLSYSPIIHRASKGVYGLIGATYSAADVEALVNRNKGRVVLDHGWTSSGAVWTAFQLNRSNIRSGIFNIPNGISGFVPDGVFEIRASNEIVGNVRVQDGTIWGVDRVFDRRGGDVGDIFVIELNASTLAGSIEIGGLDLLDRYTDDQIQKVDAAIAVAELTSKHHGGSVLNDPEEL